MEVLAAVDHCLIGMAVRDSFQMWREPGSSRNDDRQGRLSHYFQIPYACGHSLRPPYRDPVRASVAREICTDPGPFPEGKGNLSEDNTLAVCRARCIALLRRDPL